MGAGAGASLSCINLLNLSRKSSSAFTPYPIFQWYLQSKEIFIKSQYEMLKLSI
jgi:hypothetical protein